MLPTNPDFRKLEPTQAYWYYYNMVSDSEDAERAMNSNGSNSLFESKATLGEFIKAVKQDMGGKH